MKETPLQKEYREIKAVNPATLLAIRLGDFYEFFGDDAKTAATVLRIALTKRNEIAMAGVPYHAAQKYFSELILAGHKVTVAEVIGGKRIVAEFRPGE